MADCPGTQLQLLFAHTEHIQSTHSSPPLCASVTTPSLNEGKRHYFYNAHQQPYFLRRLHGDVHKYLSVKREVLLVLGKPLG